MAVELKHFYYCEDRISYSIFLVLQQDNKVENYYYFVSLKIDVFENRKSIWIESVTVIKIITVIFIHLFYELNIDIAILS